MVKLDCLDCGEKSDMSDIEVGHCPICSERGEGLIIKATGPDQTDKACQMMPYPAKVGNPSDCLWGTDVDGIKYSVIRVFSKEVF